MQSIPKHHWLFAFRSIFTSRLKGIGKMVWIGQTEPEGVPEGRQPHQITIVPYVGTWFFGGFGMGVAYQIKDLGNTPPYVVQRCGAVEIFDFAHSTYAKISCKTSTLLRCEVEQLKSTVEVKFVQSKRHNIIEKHLLKMFFNLC